MKNKKILLILLGTSVLVGCQEKEELKQVKDEVQQIQQDEEVEIKEEKLIEKIAIPQKKTEVVNVIKNESNHLHMFSEQYTEMKGMLTFRGNNRRDKTSVGLWKEEPKEARLQWSIKTEWNEEWGGGAGWTGQPLVIEWPQETLQHLAVYEKFKEEKLTEVIQTSLDGNIYFMELKSGELTREPMVIGNPIKGTASLDSRGYPLLYVGEGIPQNPNISMNVIDLTQNKIIYQFAGMDSFANRGWGAFDGSPLIGKDTDTLVTNGENGIVYNVKLNTVYNEETGEISIKPLKNKMIFTYPKQKTGIESSIVGEGEYLFTADNKGLVQAIDSETMKTLWSTQSYDDTDSTMLLSVEKSGTFLYTASEIDKQGETGYARIRKINALNGEIVWYKDYAGFSIIGENPVNGGFLATPLKGKGKMENQIVFTMARGESLSSGYIFSLNTVTGEEMWRTDMENYAWSSPAGIEDEQGNFYIVQMDSVGKIILLKNGEKMALEFNVGANVEASPIIYENYLIFSSRGGEIFNYKLN